VSRHRYTDELRIGLSLKFDQSLLRRIDRLAVDTRRTRSQVINDLCEAAIAGDEKNHAQARDLFTPAPKLHRAPELSYVERLRLAGGAA
jgi:hypothetical protein